MFYTNENFSINLNNVIIVKTCDTRVVLSINKDSYDAYKSLLFKPTDKWNINFDEFYRANYKEMKLILKWNEGNPCLILCYETEIRAIKEYNKICGIPCEQNLLDL